MADINVHSKGPKSLQSLQQLSINNICNNDIMRNKYYKDLPGNCSTEMKFEFKLCCEYYRQELINLGTNALNHARRYVADSNHEFWLWLSTLILSHVQNLDDNVVLNYMFSAVEHYKSITDPGLHLMALINVVRSKLTDSDLLPYCILYIGLNNVQDLEILQSFLGDTYFYNPNRRGPVTKNPLPSGVQTVRNLLRSNSVGLSDYSGSKHYKINNRQYYERFRSLVNKITADFNVFAYINNEP